MIISCLLQTDVQCLVTKTKCKQRSQVCVEKTEIKNGNMETTVYEMQVAQFIKALLLGG